MKLIYFSLDYTPHDHRFLSALSETEHEVHYVRLQRGRQQNEDRPVPSNIKQVLWEGGQHEFRWRAVPGYVRGLQRIIKELKPDLIHAGPIQTCAFIAALTGFHPLLTMSWGFDLMKDVHRSRWWEFTTRYALKHSAFFVSDAQVTRDKAVAYGMNPQRTQVFPWGVDLERFAPVKADGRPQDDGITLLCNRSWEPNYGVDVLARAFIRVAQQREDVSLILLGNGSQGAAIRNILINGGAIDRVTFPGYISNNDLPRFYQMADIFISPSHVDGSSVSLMEALASGLPCLVSDIPANKEWVTDSENGWLFPDGDVNALATRIMQIIQQREQLATLGRNARRVAAEKADWQKNFKVLLQSYQTASER